jgi:hypothetical protein
MSNLIPEVRTDKNGNAVTRWIRSLGKKRSTTSAPAPVIEPEDPAVLRSEQATMELLGILHPMGNYGISSPIAAKIMVVFHKDPALLQRITEAAWDHDFDREHWMDRLHLSDKLNYSQPEKLEEELIAFRTAIDVNVMVRHLSDSGVIINEQSPYLLQAAVSLILEDGGLKDPSSQMVQALTVIAYLKGKPNAVPWKKGPNKVSDIYNSIAADADYIADHLEQVVPLLPELISRSTHDRNIIDILLNSNAQVLRDGEL